MENKRKINRQEYCEDHGFDNLVFLDEIYDDAVIGVTSNGHVAYTGIMLLDLIVINFPDLSWLDIMYIYDTVVIPIDVSDVTNKQPIVIDLD